MNERDAPHTEHYNLGEDRARLADYEKITAEPLTQELVGAVVQQQMDKHPRPAQRGRGDALDKLRTLFDISRIVGPDPVALGLALVRIVRCNLRKAPAETKVRIEQYENAIAAIAGPRQERWRAVKDILADLDTIPCTFFLDHTLLTVMQREIDRLNAPLDEAGAPRGTTKPRGLGEWLTKPLGTVGER